MFRIYYSGALNDFISITNDKLHKISSVLRMKKGEQIIIFDGKGISQIMEIKDIDKNKVILEIVKKQIIKEKQTPEIILAISIIKPSRLEIAIEKTAELGISKIYPLITKNTNSTLVKRINNNRIERMKNIAISASEQCGSDFISEIESPTNLEQILSLQNNETGLIFYYENFREITKKNTDLSKYKKLIILIGPEGGFTEEEYEKLKNKSTVLGLGENILRTETAAICAVHEINSLVRSTL
jgi:16S rRNA (uracil1498-N3)-methyltransferase